MEIVILQSISMVMYIQGQYGDKVIIVLLFRYTVSSDNEDV